MERLLKCIYSYRKEHGNHEEIHDINNISGMEFIINFCDDKSYNYEVNNLNGIRYFENIYGTSKKEYFISDLTNNSACF